MDLRQNGPPGLTAQVSPTSQPPPGFAAGDATPPSSPTERAGGSSGQQGGGQQGGGTPTGGSAGTGTGNDPGGAGRAAAEARAAAAEARAEAAEASAGKAQAATGKADAAVIAQLTGKLKASEARGTRLALDKEKLENYVKQALHATQVKYKGAVQSLQKQLQERQQELEYFRCTREEEKGSRKREERLVMSAFYEVGLELQRRIMFARDGSVQQGGEGGGGARGGRARGGQGGRASSSWLARQRGES